MATMSNERKNWTISSMAEGETYSLIGYTEKEIRKYMRETNFVFSKNIAVEISGNPERVCISCTQEFDATRRLRNKISKSICWNF